MASERRQSSVSFDIMLVRASSSAGVVSGGIVTEEPVDQSLNDKYMAILECQCTQTERNQNRVSFLPVM